MVVTGIGFVAPAAAAAANRDGWFDVRSELGPRGHKYLPAACQYLLAAARRAAADAGGIAGPADQRAAIVGTNSAGTALHDEMNRTVLEDGFGALSPALSPFFSINLVPSRLAPEHGLKAFNLTLTTPRVAGLEAVAAAQRSAAAGRTSLALVGATEAALPPDEPGAASSEAGAAVLVLEGEAAAAARGARAYGICRVRTAFLSPGGSQGAASRVVESALRSLGIDRVLPAHLAADDSPVAVAVAAALARAGADVVDGGRAGAGCLQPVLRTIELLERRGGDGLVVATAPQGDVAFALVSGTAGDRNGGTHAQHS